CGQKSSPTRSARRAASPPGRTSRTSSVRRGGSSRMRSSGRGRPRANGAAPGRPTPKESNRLAQNLRYPHNPARSGPPRGNDAPAQAKRRAAMQHLSSAPPEASRATILVAEDHFDSRHALRTLLEAVGYRALEARNGREAIEQAVAEHPDLILMDIMMPEFDGLQAIRELRSREDTRSIPIIAVTAMDSAQRVSMEAGADDIVPKPVDTRALLAKVRDLVE